MFQRELAFQNKLVGTILRQAKDEEAAEAQAQTQLAPQRDPTAQLSCRVGDASCAGAHAAKLNRATLQRAPDTLRRLQRQYGNRFVQRVVNHGRRGEAETSVAPAVEQAIHSAQGGGQLLDSGVRAQMEPAFRADFSRVRVHTGGQADTLNRALRARAFTTGQDIFFKQGEYNPGSSGGRELLAHELTHVVQQQGGRVQTKLTLGQPGDQYEQEADHVARMIMQAEQRPVQKDQAKKQVGRLTEPKEDENEKPSESNAIDTQIRLRADKEEKDEIVQQVQLKKTRPIAQDIGATGGVVTFVEHPGRSSHRTLGPGERGFTRQLLKQYAPSATLKSLYNYQNAALFPIALDLSKLDEQVKMRSSQKVSAENQASGKASLWGPPTPSIKEFWEQCASDCQKHMDELVEQRSQQEERCTSFNAWVPSVNQLFVSLAQLEGLQKLLGVEEPAAMVLALTKGLKKAESIVEQAQIATPGAINAPEADRQVTSSFDETTMAIQKMHTAWLGFQQTILLKRAKSIQESGVSDKKRLAQITQAIETWGKIGKTIDFSLTLMESDGVKKLAQNVAKGVGIPTDAEGVLKGIAGLVFEREIQTIERKLAELNASIESYKEVADELGIQRKVNDFSDAIKDFQRVGRELGKRLAARQLAYLQFGEQLDTATQVPPIARKPKTVPRAGNERFATIMLLVSAVREVLAVARGARNNFDDPKSIKLWLLNLEETRTRRVKGFGSFESMSDSETRPLISLYNQVKSFHENIALLEKALQPIDVQAASLMKTANAGKEEASAY